MTQAPDPSGDLERQLADDYLYELIFGAAPTPDAPPPADETDDDFYARLFPND